VGYTPSFRPGIKPDVHLGKVAPGAGGYRGTQVGGARFPFQIIITRVHTPRTLNFADHPRVEGATPWLEDELKRARLTREVATALELETTGWIYLIPCTPAGGTKKMSCKRMYMPTE